MQSMVGIFVVASTMWLLVGIYHLYFWNRSLGPYSGCLRSWVSAFECGFMGTGPVLCFFSYTYFVLLLFFVLFDLEIALLLNLPFQGTLYNNMLYYLFFIVLMCFGYIVEVYKGYISWSY